MRNLLFAAFCISFLSGCATNQNIKVSYSNLNFYIPEGVVALGSAGGKDNFLGFKYSKTPGSRYIAFTKEYKSGSSGCSYPAFFQQVLNRSGSRHCESSAVESFRMVFDVSSASGVWHVGEHDAYYFPGENKKIFVFLILDDHTVIKIDSDFLDKEAMWAVLAE